MLQIKNDITDKSYYQLIDYILKRCDMFSYFYPHNNKIIVTSKNSEIYPEYEIGFESIRPGEDEYIQNVSNLQWRVEYIRNKIIKSYEDVEYVGSTCGCACQITIAQLDESIGGYFKSTSGLYDWIFPDMPEDLCFFSKGKCWLRSIAHEKLCFIYIEDDFEKNVLKQMGLKYYEIPDDSIPTMKYNLTY